VRSIFEFGCARAAFFLRRERRGPPRLAAVGSARAHCGRSGRYAPAGFGGAVSASFAMRIRLHAAATY
jgi:hypothetical protein